MKLCTLETLMHAAFYQVQYQILDNNQAKLQAKITEFDYVSGCTILFLSVIWSGDKQELLFKLYIRRLT